MFPLLSFRRGQILRSESGMVLEDHLGVGHGSQALHILSQEDGPGQGDQFMISG